MSALPILMLDRLGTIAQSHGPRSMTSEHSSNSSPHWGTLGVMVPTILAYAIAVWCLVAMAWDGSNYLFLTLQAGEPVITHHRYSNLPTMLAIVQASHFISDTGMLAMLYTALVAITPVASLALCMWYLRGPFASLRVWAVLGLLFSVLPGQLCIMSEASLAVQAFWPLLAIVAVGLPASALPWIVLLSVYIFFLHPTSVLLFGLAAALCVGAAARLPHQRRHWIVWTLYFLAVTLLRFLFSFLTATPYEKSELSLGPNWMAFLGAFAGPSSLMLLCLYGFGVTYLAGVVGKASSSSARKAALGVLIAFFAVGMFWAVDSRNWNGAISYRRFVLVCTIPFMAMAALHWNWLRRKGVPSAFLPSAPVLLSFAYAVIFSAQSLTWRADWRRFESTLDTAPGPLVTKSDLPWTTGRPIDHWSSTTFSIILQGRKPAVLYTESAGNVTPGGITLFPGGILETKDGWFDLSRHRANADR